MPSSYHGFIPDVIDLVLNENPKRILDIGVGFGKWGFLFREYSDIFKGRYYQKDWKTVIDGIEVFEPYIQDHHRYLYSNLYIGDALSILPNLDKYDLIFIGDVIEHFYKNDGMSLKKLILEKSKNAVFVAPLSNRWPQGEILQNKNERHLSIWEKEDFKDAKSMVIKRNRAGKPIGMFVYK